MLPVRLTAFREYFFLLTFYFVKQKKESGDLFFFFLYECIYTYRVQHIFIFIYMRRYVSIFVVTLRQNACGQKFLFPRQSRPLTL